MEKIGMKQNKERKRKPIIGIVPIFKNSSMDPYQEQAGFVRMYSDIIFESGGIPIRILTKNLPSYLQICDGYIWPGGEKVEKEYNDIIKDALKKKKPLLGICLGMQAITTFFNVKEDQKETKKSFLETYQEYKEAKPYLNKIMGENIHQHVVTKEKESIEKAKHRIKIVKNSLLYAIYQKEKVDVVSLHGIKVGRVPKTLLISAKAQDQVVEAVEYTKNDTCILGVQWHPEIMRDLSLFKWFVKECEKRKE